MKSGFDVWQRNLWLWAAPLGFCVLGLLGIVLYRTAFAGTVERLEGQHEEASRHLEGLREQRRRSEEFLARVQSHQGGHRSLYRDHFQTEAQRFTAAVVEVKTLARQAGLNPTSFSYPAKGIPEYGLIRRDIGFSVEGTYDQLRKFINFLELSEHFLTLESVSLGQGGKDQRLRIRLTLFTLFSSRKVEESTEEDAA